MRHLHLTRPRIKGSDVAYLKRRLRKWGLQTTTGNEYDEETAKQVCLFRSVMCLGEQEYVDEPVWQALTSNHVPVLWDTPVLDVEHHKFAKFAFNFVGIPYVHGSSTPFIGLDSFGFLEACWRLSANEATNLRDVEHLASAVPIRTPESRSEVVGGVAFYASKTGKINHCMYILNEALAIGAVGGNEFTRDAKRALMRDACVKVKPIDYRPGLVGFATGYQFRRACSAAENATDIIVAKNTK